MEVTTTYTGKGVKDVPANDFINAFSSYLKSTGKVRIDIRCRCSLPGSSPPAAPAPFTLRNEHERHGDDNIFRACMCRFNFLDM